MRTLVWLALLAAAACGDDAGGGDVAVDAPTGDGAIDAPPGTFPAETSGTRLKIRWSVGGDVRVRTGIVDTALGSADCYPSAWSDGQTRCTPAETGSIVFLDAGCTQPVGFANLFDCAEAPPYVTAYASPGCAGSVVDSIHQIGAERAETVYYLGAPGACSSANQLDPQARLYDLGAEVAPSTLATLTPDHVTGGARLQVGLLRGADGFVIRDRPFDTMAGAACTPFSVFDERSGVCYLPSVQASYFTDAACSIPAVVAEAQCESPTFAAVYGDRMCPGGGEEDAMIHPLTALAGEVDVYANTDSACELQDVEGTRYSLGAPFLQSITTPAVEGAAPLQLLATRDGDATVAIEGFYDTALETRCSPAITSDGVLRCAPVRPARTYFLDDACTNTVQVLRIYTGPASCGPLPPPRGGILYRDDPNNACVPRADVFRGGDEILAPLYQGAVGECSLVSRTNAKFYATTPVAATDLVEITTVVDP